MSNTPGGARRQPIETGRSEELRSVRYEDLLRAIGFYIDKHGYTDVVLTQIPDGVLLKGNVIDQTPSGPRERINSVHFTNDDIMALLEEGARRRGSTDQLRRRFRR